MNDLTMKIEYELDDLTHIYNRKAFYEHTKELLVSNKDKSFFVCAVNVDKFKVVNDLFGTRAGDELLKFIAKTIEEYVEGKACCIVGRMHADNFLMCMPEYEGCEKEISEYLDKKIEEYPLPLNIIIKCGIYHIHNMGIPVEIMCDRANMAIAQIKGKYSVNYNIYDEELRKQILQEQEINSEMINALQAGQFTPFYQPKFNMETGKIIGAEALVRWIHPEKGLISPGIFIPIFEKNGFIVKLDRYIWEQVCADISNWIRNGYAICPVSVNVSRAELYDSNLPNILKHLIEKYNIPIGLLQLEITESAYTNNPEQMINAVENLKNEGFTILMDDFGSGYSSLNTLKDIPIDVLKLDLKFLYDMENNKKADNILKSVVQMAKRLSLSVIAEGVETKNQVDFLKSVGCIKAQGYFYSKPIPRTDFEEMLKIAENVSLTDEDYREALINVDDIIGRYRREDEVEWYRSAVIMLQGVLFEYDVIRDTFNIYDMQMDTESNELQKVELPNFISGGGFLHYIYPEDAEGFKDHISSAAGGMVEYRLKDWVGNSDSYGWYRFTDHSVKNDEGQATSVVGVILNVSGNYQARAIMSVMSIFANADMTLREKLRACSEIIFKNFNANKFIIDFPKRNNSHEDACVVYEFGKAPHVDNSRKIDEQLMYDIHMASDDYNISVLPSDGDTTIPIYLADIDDKYTVMLSYVYTGRGKKLSESDRRQLSEVSRCIVVNIEKYIRERSERMNLEMYANAFRSSTAMIREWDIETGDLIRSDGYAESDGRGKVIPNVPESLIADGYVHPDYIDEYRRVFAELKAGKDQILMVKVKSKSGCYEWLWCDYRVIFDENNKPVKAVGSGEKVNSIFSHHENTRRQLKQTQQTIPGVISWIEADLTDDVIIAMSGDVSDHNMADNSYSALSKHIAEVHVDKKDQQRYLDTFDIENVKALIIDGRQMLHMRYRMQHDNGSYEWRETCADVYQSREDGHFKLFAYVRNVDDQIKWQEYVEDEVKRDSQLHIYEKEYFRKLVDGIIKNENTDKSVLLLIDMDKFGMIKESFGKNYSDEIIKNILTITKGTIRPGMLLGKYYDDRFAIFIKEMKSMQEVYLLSNTLQKRIFNAFHAGNDDYVLSVSVGVAYCCEIAENNFDNLYKEAERILLETKNCAL